MSWASHGLQALTRTQEKSQTRRPLTLCHPVGWQSSGMRPRCHFSSSQHLLLWWSPKP